MHRSLFLLCMRKYYTDKKFKKQLCYNNLQSGLLCNLQLFVLHLQVNIYNL